MKHILNILGLIFISCGVVYLLTAFLSWELIPKYWSVWAIIVNAIIYIFSIVYITIFYLTKQAIKDL